MLLSVDLDQERLISATANTKLHLQSGCVDHRCDHHIDHHGEHHSHHGNHHVDHRGDHHGDHHIDYDDRGDYDDRVDYDDHHGDHQVDYDVLDGAIGQPCFWPQLITKVCPTKSSIIKRGIMTTLIPMISATT